jgi:hypothetical protein
MDDLWRIEIEVVAVTTSSLFFWSGQNRPGVAELGLVLGGTGDGLSRVEWNMTVERVGRPEGAPWPPARAFAAEWVGLRTPRCPAPVHAPRAITHAVSLRLSARVLVCPHACFSAPLPLPRSAARLPSVLPARRQVLPRRDEAREPAIVVTFGGVEAQGPARRAGSQPKPAQATPRAGCSSPTPPASARAWCPTPTPPRLGPARGRLRRPGVSTHSRPATTLWSPGRGAVVDEASGRSRAASEARPAGKYIV